MKKYAIQFNNRTITAVSGHTERAVFNFLVSVLAVSFATYVLFVAITILNIVERKNLEMASLTLKSKVTELELNYLSETRKIDLDLAYSSGFKDAANTAFVSRKGAEKALSFAKNE